jgi:tetratricopeptide (TPR) repeat protein
LPAVPQLAWTLTEAGRFEEAHGFIEELTETRDARWNAYAAVVRPFHDALSGSGSVDAGRPGFAAARKTFEELGDDVGLGRALFMEGGAEWSACRAESSIELLRAALASAARAGDAALLQDILSYLISAYSHGPMRVSEAEREIRAIVEASPGLLVEATAHRALGRFAAMRGDFETARELARRGRDPLAEAGSLVLHAATSQVTAFIEALAGDHETAVRLLRDGSEALDALGEHAFASTNAVFIAWHLCGLRRDDEAEQWLARARELSPEADISTLATADCVEAVLRARRGEHEEAERVARGAVAVTETIDFWDQRARAHETLAWVLAEAGRGNEAREAVRAAIAVYEEKGSVVSAEQARALLAEL